MGLRYRKSINLGGGFKINLSKSGVGYSWGVKGARVTKTSRGTTRTTLSIPGTGISHVTETSNKAKSNNKNLPTEIEESYGQVVSTETINIKDCQSKEYVELLSRIKKVKYLDTLANILLIAIFAVYTVPFVAILGIVGLLLKLLIFYKLAVPIEYEFDEEAKEDYDKLYSSCMSLKTNKKIWQIISEAHNDGKVHGGASKSVNRVPAKIINNMPYYIYSNINLFGMKLKKMKIFFLPDKLLIISGMNVGVIDYKDLQIEIRSTSFIEEEAIPKDGKVIGYTWQKVNKDGSPDKRFKGNKQLTVCEYGKMILESGESLHVEIMFSNSEIVDKLNEFTSIINN